MAFFLSLVASEAAADTVIFIRAGLATPDQLSPYAQAAQEQGYFVRHFHIPMGLLSADHERDHELLVRELETLKSLGERLILFGYSIGGKFAARVALDHPDDLKGSFLLDPVDGGPPIFPRLWPQLPVFFRRGERGEITVPTHIVATQFGEARGPSGLRCVNRGLGARHFGSFVRSDKLSTHFLWDAGHLDLILPPDGETDAGGSCPKGTRGPASVIAEARTTWNCFLARLDGVEAPECVLPQVH